MAFLGVWGGLVGWAEGLPLLGAPGSVWKRFQLSPRTFHPLSSPLGHGWGGWCRQPQSPTGSELDGTSEVIATERFG